MKDPICGMSVDPTAALTAERDGKEFFFCSESCRERFLSIRTKTIPTSPCAIVIFGASGDLAGRKLLPAIYNLLLDGILPETFAIIGVSRKEWTRESFAEHLREALLKHATRKVDADIWRKIERHIYFCEGGYDRESTYNGLKDLLVKCEQQHGTLGNALFYLSVPTVAFAGIARHLGAMGLLRESGEQWRRLVVEKPFGYDLKSAQELTSALRASLEERQVYRVDHYLGKETAQNILVFRLGNSMVEPVWDRRYIDHVQITVAESIGVEGRGGFYEETGAFRDMMQNHMFMLLALVAMEPPTSLAGEAARNEKVKLLESIRIPKPEDVLLDTVRGQYASGTIQGRKVPAYREEASVAPTSNVETFAAITLSIDNWRWAGVPFFLRTGKRLQRRVSEVVVRFKSPPLALFQGTECDPLGPNLLIMHIQPEEGITLQMRGKTPGPTIQTQAVALDFDYSQFGSIAPTTGYEKLLYDCMVGDTTLFHRADMVEAAWRVADPIVNTWRENGQVGLIQYEPGSWGPAAAHELLRRGGRDWWTR
jgi:glucose-6-phosphate 1-dehydrogenase